MTRTRAEIIAEHKATQDQISQLECKLENLWQENCLLSDETQWYIEKEEEIVMSSRPKKTQIVPVGRIHWKERFIDEATKEPLMVERSRVVRVNGIWK